MSDRFAKGRCQWCNREVGHTDYCKMMFGSLEFLGAEGRGKSDVQDLARDHGAKEIRFDIGGGRTVSIDDDLWWLSIFTSGPLSLVFAVLALIAICWQCQRSDACHDKDGVYLWDSMTCVKKDGVIE